MQTPHIATYVTLTKFNEAGRDVAGYRVYTPAVGAA